jgi:hypothetical protein
MYDEKLMLLLGAGASIPVGIPGMVEMADRFQKDIGKEQLAHDGYEALIRFGAGTDVEQLLQLANAIIEFPNHNLGTFVEECVRGNRKDSRFVGEVSRRRNKIVREVSSFRERLLAWLTQTCLSFDRDKAYELFGTFAEVVSANGVPVFTTNYDGVLEFVAERKRIPIVDNFLKKGARSYWDPSLASFSDTGLRLVKIHGSIYWHADDSGLIERIDPPVEFNSEGRPVERLIIVPTRFKDIYQRNYFPLYTSFLRTLGNSKVIIVAGHSMRDEYLLAAVRDRLRDRSFRVIVLDPAFPAKDALLAGADERKVQIAHIPQKLEEAIGLFQQMICMGQNPDEVFRVAKDAETAIESGASPLVEVTSFGQWLDGGKQAAFRLRVRTTQSIGVISAVVEPRKRKENLLNLTPHLAGQWGDPPRLLSFHDESRTSRFYCSKGLGIGPHRLKVELRSPEGRLLAKAERSFRIKGL